MVEQVSRRNFFKLIGGAVALAATPINAIANIIEIPVEFGWTWYVDKTKVPSNLSEIITKTLRENANALRDNMSNSSSLYVKLKDHQKVKLNIERIPEDVQTSRMNERIKERLKHKSAPVYECVDNVKEKQRLEAKKQAIIDGVIPHPLSKQASIWDKRDINFGEEIWRNKNV